MVKIKKQFEYEKKIKLLDVKLDRAKFMYDIHKTRFFTLMVINVSIGLFLHTYKETNKYNDGLLFLSIIIFLFLLILTLYLLIKEYKNVCKKFDEKKNLINEFKND